MKRLRGIGVQLVIFFIIAISIPTFMLAIDVVVQQSQHREVICSLQVSRHFRRQRKVLRLI